MPKDRQTIECPACGAQAESLDWEENSKLYRCPSCGDVFSYVNGEYESKEEIRS